MHFEHEHLIAFAIDPGWVKTTMGNIGAKVFGLEEAETEIDESVNGMLRVVSICLFLSVSLPPPSHLHTLQLPIYTN